MSEEKFTNRLIDEKSPYLRMHAHNPVDWYPWGEEAFARATAEDLPIFLSIGYAACHWCHVMEKESFSDAEVAALLNRHFIAVKVDREERPDIDALYMIYAQALSANPGWPLTVVMTPDKKPFFATSYVPKYSKFGRKGLMDILPEIDRSWKERKETVIDSSERLHDAIETLMTGGVKGRLDEEAVHGAYHALKESFDPTFGGFGHAPKFPMPHTLLFLLRYWYRYGEDDALFMAEKTLDSIFFGGIHDHIGGGFHRYSTDREWLVPHFEKMLYDQALLLIAYTEAWQATKRPLYEEASVDIVAYMLRELRSEEGAFFAAEDADSEGGEGTYYLWTDMQFNHVLKTDAAHAKQIFNVRPEGNYLDETTKMYNGKNILFRTHPDLLQASKTLIAEQTVEYLAARLESARRKRIHPLVDTKILTDWNGLAVAALARAGAVMDRKGWVDDAATAYHFIATTLADTDGRLFHRYCDGEVAIPGMLEDYAFLLWGLLELYDATFEARYLDQAVTLADTTLVHFAGEDGSLYRTADDTDAFIRQRQAYDGAFPSGTSVLALCLLRLARMTANPAYESAATTAMEWYAKELQTSPTGYTHLLSALIFAAAPPLDAVIIPGATATDQDMIRALAEGYTPTMTTILLDRDAIIRHIAPHTADMTTGETEGTVVHLCTVGGCHTPLTSAEEVRTALRKKKEC
ncbi:hypothetical protein AZH53_04310 [Methanomicrobiaceae archaeon CYW5]|uniref:thioredoxin domain-containing protein n=1 Tax=Methanovulcanius yangii TaxID=1789227 RepID=UPI0029C9D798|nr:thioredoxin domain-containing protein [Methanovulcanius yangii]MBT8507641.1 hypothetical protein [Methanovulcanius yangii]